LGRTHRELALFSPS
jgi:DNA replication protein DnaC